MKDCLFCRIMSGEIPSTKVYEDETIYAFRDIAPMAPVHILIVPKAHIASAADITTENADLIAHIFAVIPQIAAAEGLENGFRVVTNSGADACQSVQHLHFHLLGGAKMADRMA